MIRDITFGQYYPIGSPIHRLDPRTKLAGTLIFIIALFVAKGLWAYIIATIFLGAVIRVSKVPLSYMVRGLKSIVILLLFSVVFNIFFIRDGVVLVQIGFITITAGGLIRPPIWPCV